MLVAKKQIQEYDINIEEPRFRKKTKHKEKNTTIATKSKVKLVALSVVVLGVCLGILLLNAYVSQLKYELLSLNKSKEELFEEKSLLEIKIDKIKQSDWIEEAAISQLGMSYPTRDQIIYVSLDNINNGVKNELQVGKTTFFKSTLNKLIGLVK
ncbi:cell division protein FtsL [Abyssisolibacter fermentans]|uniref:cell division protein FtsL n=1 Tax=Abyssisolibacter fermentans TaxID=1766203 RepID=UPI000830439E|nr:cell division protein FtsL [Abyssisolibacter fermentans]